MRTVAAIEAAVRDALRATPLDELSVAEVCRLAGVGRPSFYTHFDSTDAEGQARAIRDQMPRWWPFPD